MITLDELKKLARLAKLSLDGEDTDALAADITSILEFANTVSEAVVDLPAEEVTGAYDLREDIVAPSSPIEEILLNAAEKQDTYFVARKRGGTGA